MPRYQTPGDRVSKFVMALIILLFFEFKVPLAAQQGAGSNTSNQDPATGRAESSSRRAARISESQLVGLPLNGRSYSQLATLEAGVSDVSSASASRGVGGGSLNVSGARGTSNVFLLDGTNIMNHENRVPRSAAGVQLGSDAVQQVQIFSTTYSAEYGRGNGGVLNSITRSGTPQFHGNLFEYFRNSKLDARNFFDADSEPPPFKRNQFGFTITGPIRKDKTFFLFSYEGLRDRLSETNIDYYPDERARLGRILRQDGTEEIVPGAVHPEVQPYLKLLPLPSSTAVGGINQVAGVQFLPTDENFFTVRLDHEISQRDSFFARYTFDDATSQAGEASYLFKVVEKSRQQYLTLVESHIFSSTLLNTFRFGYTRPINATDNLSEVIIPPPLYFFADAVKFGRIDVPGLTPFGFNTVAPERNPTNTFQFADDLIAQKGAHGLKFGLQIHRYHWDTVSTWNQGGTYSFNSFQSFLQGGPNGTRLEAALPGSDNRTAFRQTLVGLYLHDEYQLSSRLQFSLGLRYEFATLIHDKNGKTAFLVDPLRDPRAQIGPYLKENPSMRNLSPRLGITWSPDGSGNTVLSAGFGIYYDQLLEYVVDTRKSTAPFYKVVVKPNFDSSVNRLFPDAEKAAEGLPPLAQILDYSHMTTPQLLRYNFDLQQQLPWGWSAQTSYVGARGNHLFRGYEANLFPFPITGKDGSLFFPPHDPQGPDNRMNPNFGSINIITSDAQSFYNAFQFSANKSLSRGLSIRASYTYSKSVDDSSSSGGGGGIQYGWMRTLERGLSDYDTRHRLTASYFYTPPLGSGQRWGKSGWMSHLFGNWRIGGILTYRTGSPFSPGVNIRTPGYLFAAGRPNLLPGQSNNPIQGVTAGCVDPVTGREAVPAGRKLGTPELYFDPCVFDRPPAGTLGNVGRNTLTGPSLFNMDVSLQKDFPLGGDRRLQFRAEMFNLPNHPGLSRNTGGTVIIFSGATGRRNTTAGKLDRTANTARQLQFALRLSF